MSDPKPRRSATDAMHLKPAAQRRQPAEPVVEPVAAIEPTSPARVDAVAGARALDELLELHSRSLVRFCRECLLEYPCRTRRLLEVVAGTPTPPEDGSRDES